MRIRFEKKTKVTLALIVCVLVFSGLFIVLKSSPKSVNDAIKGDYVTAKKLQVGEYRPIVPLTVTARSGQNTTVSAFVSARVEDIYFKVGQKVKAGELLLRLEPDLFEIDYDKQSANIALTKVNLESNQAQCKLDQVLVEQKQDLYELAQANYERRALLHVKSYGSKADLDLAKEKLVNAKTDLKQQQFNLEDCFLTTKRLQAELLQAQASARLAKKNLSETLVQAPYGGVITDKFVSVGRMVSVGQQLFSLYDPNSVELEGLIPDRVYEKIKNIKQDIFACRSGFEQKNCYQLKRISENVSQLGLGHIGFFASEKMNSLSQGQTITLYLRLPKLKVYAVPVAAVYQGDTVFCIQNNKLIPKQVKILGKWANEKGNLYYLIRPNNFEQTPFVMTSYLPGARRGMLVHYAKEDSSNGKK